MRDLSKAKVALATMPGVTSETLDLMDPASIDAFADRFIGSGQALHILVNNAGIMANPLTRDARGYESQFSTNHLGHFQLTIRLWPALRRAKSARVVALSSVGHRRGAVDFEDQILSAANMIAGSDSRRLQTHSLPSASMRLANAMGFEHFQFTPAA